MLVLGVLLGHDARQHFPSPPPDKVELGGLELGGSLALPGLARHDHVLGAEGELDLGGAAETPAQCEQQPQHFDTKRVDMDNVSPAAGPSHHRISCIYLLTTVSRPSVGVWSWGHGRGLTSGEALLLLTRDT